MNKISFWNSKKIDNDFFKKFYKPFMENLGLYDFYKDELGRKLSENDIKFLELTFELYNKKQNKLFNDIDLEKSKLIIEFYEKLKEIYSEKDMEKIIESPLYHKCYSTIIIEEHLKEKFQSICDKMKEIPYSDIYYIYKNFLIYFKELFNNFNTVLDDFKNPDSEIIKSYVYQLLDYNPNLQTIFFLKLLPVLHNEGFYNTETYKKLEKNIEYSNSLVPNRENKKELEKDVHKLREHEFLRIKKYVEEMNDSDKREYESVLTDILDFEKYKNIYYHFITSQEINNIIKFSPDSSFLKRCKNLDLKDVTFNFSGKNSQ